MSIYRIYIHIEYYIGLVSHDTRHKQTQSLCHFIFIKNQILLLPVECILKGCQNFVLTTHLSSIVRSKFSIVKNTIGCKVATQKGARFQLSGFKNRSMDQLITYNI